MLTPKDTINRLNKLMLSDEEFRQIHHLNGTKGKNETVQSHIKYLTGRKSFNKSRDNYIVALRLECVENLENQGYVRKNAISSCIAEYKFNKKF